MKAEIGIEIYYHGDMANEPGFGKIVDIKTDRFGTFCHILYEDGRTTIINDYMISEKYQDRGTMFVTKKAYEEHRNFAIKMLRDSYLKK